MRDMKKYIIFNMIFCFLAGSIIAQQTPVLMLLAFAQLIIITTGSIDISVGSSLAFSAFFGAIGMLWFGDVGLIVGVLAGGLVGMVNGIIISLLK